MRRLLLSTALSALLVGAALSSPARAQTDVRSLYDRIDRLERDLMTMQQQAARGGIAQPRANANDGSVAGTMASRLDDRINELEEANRMLTGKLEEANFRANQLSKQMERMQADLDLRFKDLEAARPAQAAQPLAQQPGQVSMPGPQAATGPGGAPVLIPPKGLRPGANAADNDGPAPGPQNLGSMSAGALKKGEAEASREAAKAPAKEPPKDPQGAYEEAYGLLQKGDYDGAERGLSAFLKAHPNHQLAGNAHYWLADMAFSQRKDFETSAKLFADAYKKFPNHSKAPDMLYKLGASFAHLEKKAEACKVYSLLGQTHPDMSDRLKRAVAGEKQRLGCK